MTSCDPQPHPTRPGC